MQGADSLNIQSRNCLYAEVLCTGQELFPKCSRKVQTVVMPTTHNSCIHLYPTAATKWYRNGGLYVYSHIKRSLYMDMYIRSSRDYSNAEWCTGWPI